MSKILYVLHAAMQDKVCHPVRIATELCGYQAHFMELSLYRHCEYQSLEYLQV